MTAQVSKHLSLIADIGATNMRLALFDGDDRVVGHVQIQASNQHSSIQEAIGAYLAEHLPLAERRRVNAAAIAVAAPVTADWVTLTNHAWSFSINQLRGDLWLERLIVINDFTAIATAIPYLTTVDREQIGGGVALASAPIGVIGPGSGLGVGALIPAADAWVPIAGEGGHVTLAPATSCESDVLNRLRDSFGHVSAERVLSGPGLVNLHQALMQTAGATPISYTPAQITDPSLCECDPYCREAVEMFCAILGTVAGNLALTIGAQGGIYIAGGIVPKLGKRFAQSQFRKRFEDKGRLQPYLARIPTYVIVHPFPALVGLSKVLTT